MINDPERNPSSQTRLPEQRRYFVSRHPGAIEWAKQHPWAQQALFVSHLEIAQIVAGDIVIGSLPVHLASAVCARGAHYFHLALDLSADLRGSELTVGQLEAANARLVPYRVLYA